MWHLKILPSKTNIRFIEWRKTFFFLSIALIFASIASVSLKGLNFGIDFKGGILIEIRTEQAARIGDLRDKLNTLGLGEVTLQEFGKPTDVLIRIQQQEGGEKAQTKAITAVKEALGSGIEYRRVEFVGPQVGSELREAGIKAVIIALIAILIYIWFRFEWQFGVAAIIALAHDIFITIGLFSVLKLEFNLSILAAILTIAGYSINDTVVVFDRVRENLRKYKKSPLPEVLNRSINETLARTLMTSITTLAALLCLFFFGGEVIRGFSFAMIWGVIIGTYSSIFIASPILILLNLRLSETSESTKKA